MLFDDADRQRREFSAVSPRSATDGVDGRTGSDTIKAILAFEKKVGMHPADGYAGLKVLARVVYWKKVGLMGE